MVINDSYVVVDCFAWPCPGMVLSTLIALPSLSKMFISDVLSQNRAFRILIKLFHLEVIWDNTGYSRSFLSFFLSFFCFLF